MYETTPFTIEITDILIASAEFDLDDLDGLVVPDSEISIADILQFVRDENYTTFVFLGTLNGPEQDVDIVAVAYSTSGMDSRYSVVLIYDPSDAENGITLKNLMIRRALSDKEGTNIPDEFIANAREGRRLNSCSEGLNDIQCNSGEQREVDSACVNAARIAFDAAVDTAQGEYDTAIAVSQAVKNAAVIAWNAKKARDFAKQLIPCVLIGVLSGPLGYALCATRALAIVVAKMLAVKLAIDAAFELAKRNALTLLELAVDAACAAFGATLRVSNDDRHNSCHFTPT